MVKNEHIVPQGHLRFFKCSKKDSINVYDKESNIVRLNQPINKVCCINKFYDIDWNDSSLKKKYEYDISKSDPQVIEKILSEKCDRKLPLNIKKLISIYEKDNFYNKIIRKLFWYKYKKDFIFMIYYQYLRTREIKIGNKQMVESLINCLENLQGKLSPQMEEYLNYGKEYIENKNLQNDLIGTMLFDKERFAEVHNKLKSYIFIVGKVNSTNKLYISDNPVVTKAWKDETFCSYSGILSEGIEIAFPLTPDYILVLYEPTFHRDIKAMNYNIIELDENNVNYYNELQVRQSTKYIFSSEKNFDLAKEICKDDKNICNLNRQRIFSNKD